MEDVNSQKRWTKLRRQEDKSPDLVQSQGLRSVDKSPLKCKDRRRDMVNPLVYHLKNMRRSLIYCQVSTEEQAEKGYSGITPIGVLIYALMLKS